MRTTHANFGLLVDLSHFPITYESSQFVVQTLRPYITHLHFGNAVVKEGCAAYGDKHPRLGFPGSANDTEELLDYFAGVERRRLFQSRESAGAFHGSVSLWRGRGRYLWQILNGC